MTTKHPASPDANALRMLSDKAQDYQIQCASVPVSTDSK